LALGELAYVHGELFVLFVLWIGGLCSLLEHGFVSDVSSRRSFLRGLRLVLLHVILLLAFPSAFDHLLEILLVVSFLFFFSLWLEMMCVFNALIKGEIEDHVWFED
jgi:predicted MFS family arabinose efflux permease